MEIVLPIKDKYLIYEIYDYLKNKKSIGVPNGRDYVLVYLGFNFGLRIGDLLSLRKFHFDNNNRHLVIKEEKIKRKKKHNIRRMIIKPKLRKIVNDYVKSNDLNDYLFVARYSDEKMSRYAAYDVMKDIGKQFKIDKIGTHTLKKTFGYHFFHDTSNLPMLQYIFNHASAEETLGYIGLNQEDQDSVLIDFEI